MYDITWAKQILRQKSQYLRKQHNQFPQFNTSRLIQNIFDFICCECSGNQAVAAFWPLVNEPDLRGMLFDLHKAGYRIVLPETPPKGEALRFRLWYPGVTMLTGRYKTLYPDAEIVEPDCILIPLLAFDRAGHRLGYGGGYYDRTLQKYPLAKTAGVAFSYQEASFVPVEVFDQSLSVIITELEIIDSKKE